MNNLVIINNYDIFLDINIKKLLYTGFVIINITFNEQSDFLEINSKINEIILLKINNKKFSFSINKETENIIIKNNFSKGDYQIEITFNNKITDEMDGFYYTKKNNKIVLCTQLEPISARKFIPCFDLPNLKAIFNLVVIIDLQYQCISNSQIKNIFKHPQNLNKKIIYFNQTPKMSTYLLCLVVGDIVPVLTQPIISLNQIKINGYCIESDKKFIKWSIIQTKKALEFFENWFDIKYPLNKLDICSIPNFSAGAMENWGLITFREEFILLYNKTNLLAKIKILEVIYHEIAHQWFGNLVTLNNWNDLWLNESTATYFSWMGLEIIYPNYNIPEIYWLLECKGIYLIDAIENTHPILMISKDNHTDPKELFDEITYSKGNIIIRYIVGLLGINNFQKSIIQYLKENLYSNPDSEKLYMYFNKYSSSNNIDYVMLTNQLIKTKGYPIIYFTLTNNKFYINIKTFNLDKNKLNNFLVNFYLKIKIYDNKQDKWIEQIIYLGFDENNNNNNINKLISPFDKFIINPNNELLSIIKYKNFKPYYESMNQNDIMKYSHDEFILFLYGYNKFDDYIEIILDLFKKIDMVTNNLLLFSILSDINKLFNICHGINFDTNPIVKKIKQIINDYFIDLIKKIILSKCNYLEMIIDQIFITKSIYFQNKSVITIIFKLYSEQKNLNDYNLFYMSKSIFKVIVKYYQNEELYYLIQILQNCSNVQIITNLIESFQYLNEQSFDKIFYNYKNLIKSQNYLLFFFSIGKIQNKQEFLIDYWVKNQKEISLNDETRYKILKNIISNIYNIDRIDKITKIINENYSIKYKLIFGKIINILETNKIIADNIFK